MAIEVIERHEYHEPKYLTRCYLCKSVLRFTKSDLADSENFGYSLPCPVCGNENSFPISRHKWPVFEVESDK